MDLFGSHQDTIKETKKPIPGHVPIDLTTSDERQKVKVEEERSMKKEERVDEPEVDAVDLGGELVKRKKRIVWLVKLIGLIVILMIVTMGVKIFLDSRPAPQEPITQQPTTPQPTTTIPQPTTNNPPPTIIVPLPDTPLAPLRGAIVKFRGESLVYLVENNGELRVIDVANVIFDNGQRMSEIGMQLIYEISDQYKTVRKGLENVSGQVDFDPRILTNNELQQFK